MLPSPATSPASKTMAVSPAGDTSGTADQPRPKPYAYQIGVSDDKGGRRTMEDAHSYVVDYDAIRGQGFFAVFDGHAGKHAAEWCGAHFHETLLETLHEAPEDPIPDVLNRTFHKVDASLSRMCEESDGKIHSGCTAVTTFLRIEDENGQQTFLSNSPTSSTAHTGGAADTENGSETHNNDKQSGSRRIRRALKSLGGGLSSSDSMKDVASDDNAHGVQITIPPSTSRRVLYCANAGDARGVICRRGKAVRLTYDHKGTDKQEAKRITDAGGFVMSGRVNGVLAVTRSLGDSAMKEFVVGAPYTTETELCDEDEFLILACDGLWDVISDQAAADLIRNVEDAQKAANKLLSHALSQHTSDNVTVIVVRFHSKTH